MNKFLDRHFWKFIALGAAYFIGHIIYAVMR